MSPPRQHPPPSGFDNRSHPGAPPPVLSRRTEIDHHRSTYNPSLSTPAPSSYWTVAPQHQQQTMQYTGIPYVVYDDTRASVSQYAQMEAQPNVAMAPYPMMYQPHQYWHDPTTQPPLVAQHQPGVYNFQQQAAENPHWQGVPAPPEPLHHRQQQIHSVSKHEAFLQPVHTRYTPPVASEYVLSCQCTQCNKPVPRRPTVPFPEFDQQQQGKEHPGIENFKRTMEKISQMENFDSYFAFNEDIEPSIKSGEPSLTPVSKKPTYADVAGRGQAAGEATPTAPTLHSEAWCPFQGFKENCQLNHDTTIEAPNHFRPQDPKSKSSLNNKYVQRWLENVLSGKCPEDMTRDRELVEKDITETKPSRQ